MICQACGVEAPTKHVAFYQNIGALIMRFSKHFEGDLCKSCIHKYFWRFTLTNAFLGWWGMISFIVTPFFILNNVGRYVFCLGVRPVPPGATPPELTDEAIGKLQPLTGDIAERLNAGEDLNRVAEDIGARAGVTPGQVVHYIQALIEASRRKN